MDQAMQLYFQTSSSEKTDTGVYRRDPSQPSTVSVKIIKIDPVRLTLTPKTNKSHHNPVSGNQFGSFVITKEDKTENHITINENGKEEKIIRDMACNTIEDNKRNVKTDVDKAYESHIEVLEIEKNSDDLKKDDKESPSFDQKDNDIHISKEEERKDHAEIQTLEVPQNISNTQRIRQTQDVIFINGNNQEFTPPVTQNVQRLCKQEVNIYLAQQIGFLVTIIILSVFVLLMNEFKLPVHGIFVAFQGYFAYRFLISVLWTRKLLGDLFTESESDVEMINTSFWVLTSFMAYLYYSGVVSLLLLACAPFIALTTVSLVLSQAEIQKRIVINSIRFFYIFQILFIALKVDGIIPTDWIFVFFLPCLLLCARSYFLIEHGRSLFKLLISVLLKKTNLNAQNKDRIAGYFWSSLLYGLNLIGLVTLIGIRQAYSGSGNFTLLCIAAYISLGFATVLILFTMTLRERLIEFIIANNFIKSLFPLSEEIETQKAKNVIAFLVERKEQYFAMVSPTYFLPLQKMPNTKDEENLETIRKIFKDVKYEKSQVENQRKETGSKAMNLYNLNPEALKQIKEDLEIKILKIWRRKSDMKKLSKRKLITICDARDVENQRNDTNMIEENEIGSNNKLSLSFDNLGSANRIRESIASSKPKENLLCYICCINQPDAILVDCGHGGVCYNCVSTSLEKKNECMECRRKVKGVYKINPTPVFSNIIKGVELHKILVQTRLC